MSESRKRVNQYSSNFKKDAVELSLNGELSRKESASNLGISISTLNRWIREYREQGCKSFPGNGNPRDKELSRLVSENKRLKMERDILKKATAFFVQDGILKLGKRNFL